MYSQTNKQANNQTTYIANHQHHTYVACCSTTLHDNTKRATRSMYCVHCVYEQASNCMMPLLLIGRYRTGMVHAGQLHHAATTTS